MPGKFGGWAGLAVLGGALLAVQPAAAQQQDAEARQRIEQLQRQVAELQRQLAQRDTAQMAELRRQIEAISRELEEMRLAQGGVAVEADTSAYGLAPAASKVYRVQQGVSIGGYGEFHYENFERENEAGDPVNTTDQFDALRAILYFGYKFNDRLLFNSELEWEHGSTGQGGEASIEFAYLDYLLTPSFGVRAGLLLSPMGLTNELHEPPIFLGSSRPMVEQAIIPTTWRANGAGIFAQTDAFAFRAYAMTTFDAVGTVGGNSTVGGVQATSRASGFGAGGLRGGRQKGAREVSEDFGVVARADYTGFPGLMLGGSIFTGETAQNRRLAVGTDTTEVGARTTIWEVHGDYRAFGLDLRGLYAQATVDEAEKLNALRGLSGNASIGEKLTGGYLQAGYDVLRAFDTAHQLVPYLRWETLNTQAEVPAGFSANPATERQATLFGVMWKPIPQVSVKADYQLHTNEAETGINQFNINIGYLF